MKLEPVIGIEIHVELKTKSKMFSQAPTSFGKAPNSQTVIYDLAFPGCMPIVNKQAVSFGIKVCKALNMQIAKTLYFDRKNYFYPDLPKGYQITQQFEPIGRDGYVLIQTSNGEKKIRVENAHLEEDTAKQIHLNDCSLVDFNRCGTPLIEIVSLPDIKSGEEAMKYVEAIREIVTYLDVSDGKMENGSLRCDINISLKEVGSDKLGVKTECKNLNSISNIKLAVDYEINRQTKIIESLNKVTQETRRWDDSKKETILMRVKTGEVDYKYFREPNIIPIDLDENFIKDSILSMNKLPSFYRNQLKEYGLNPYQIEELLKSKELVLYFDECVKLGAKSCTVLFNLLTSDILGYLNKTKLTLKDLKFSTAQLVELSNMVSDNLINSKQTKEVLQIMIDTGRNPQAIAKDNNFVQISNEDEIKNIVDDVIKNNPQSIIDWHNGKDKCLGFLLGQVMKESKGKANPNIAKKFILDIIGPCGTYIKK